MPILSPETLSLLACPVCYQPLSVEGAANSNQQIRCTGCSRVYPVVDGIPVLIPSRAMQ